MRNVEPELPFDEQQHNPGNRAAGMRTNDSSKRALDELFAYTRQYRSTAEYIEMMNFVSHFRLYSPFNAMLAHVQMPGAVYVAPAGRWLSEFNRHIKPGARPLVMLQPRGPVMFVFDVSQTEPLADAPELPMSVTKPFDVPPRLVVREFELTCHNARRDGIHISEASAGSQSAGQVSPIGRGLHVIFAWKSRSKILQMEIERSYELLLNAEHKTEAKYATLVHELAHVYCGHLGTQDPAMWPDRRHLSLAEIEFEAESVCYLVCRRAGIENHSEAYLSSFLDGKGEIPSISIDTVLKVAGLIEQMGRTSMKPR